MTASVESQVSEKISHIQALETQGKGDEAMQMAVEFLREARDYYQENPQDAEMLFQALGLLGDMKRERGDSQAAEAIYREAVELSEEHKLPGLLLADVQAGLACIYDFNGREVESVSFYESALRLYEENGRTLQAGNLANNLAMVHKGLEQFGDAERNYLKALEIFRSVAGRDHDSTAAVYNNLGGLYYAAGFADQARDMHQEALEVRRRLYGESHPDVAQSYANLAAVAHELGQTQRAKDYFERSLYILEGFGKLYAEDLLITLDNFRELCLATGDDRRAAALLKRLEQL